MNDLELRIPAHLSDPLEQAVDSSRGERVAFGLVASGSLQSRRLLLLRELIEAPPEAYLSPGAHGARWTGGFTIQVLNRALAANLGVVIFHEHAFGNPVRLSRDDVESGTQQLEAFARIQPQRPHGTVVMGTSSSAGMFSINGQLMTPAHLNLRLIRGRLDDRRSDAPGSETGDAGEFVSQALVVGGAGQDRLRQTSVAVVGLSGGGSHVVQQLAHLGVGRIIGVDDDRAELRNRSRMIGLTASDVRRRRRKTDVLATLVRHVNLGAQFVPVSAAVPFPEAVAAIREADIIVGCLDNYHARADLQQLAWRSLIPYVDIGLRIDPDQREARPDSWIGGNVNTLLPGSHCLWCLEYLTQAKLDGETGGRDRSYFQSRSGAAQVVSLNGVLASQAVNEVLQLLTGFAVRDPVSRMLKFNGVEGTLTRWRVNPNPTCPHCRDHLAAGDPEWQVA
jgi:hypothetical protein